jgi:UPF0755 protein
VNRLVKIGVVGCAVLVMLMVISAGGLFLISGGNPVNYVQKFVLRMSLSGRTDDINYAVNPLDSEPVRFTVNLGDTPRLIADNLVVDNLITDSRLFVDYVQLNDLDRQLEAGTYFLYRSQTLAEIAQALTDSRNSSITFVILEGERLEEIIAKIDGAQRFFGFSGAEFAQVVGPGAAIDPIFVTQMVLPPGASLEGFLFPDTYQFPADVTATMMRDMLLKTFTERIGTQLLLDASSQGLNMYQVVTLASIVQREAVHDDEKPLIAGVYRNRLNIGQRLEADPTVQYGIGFRDGSWWPRITVADYSNAISSYNTYLNEGLPPGPIASPGLAAIQAAVYPEASDFYFFRADCRTDGYHEFARTFEEHVANGC